MKQNNHSFDISTFDTITYRIHRGKLAILIEDGDNHLDISFPIKDGQLFVILGSMRAAVAEAMTDYLEVEAYADDWTLDKRKLIREMITRISRG